MLRFIYPQSLLSPRQPDEMFQEEAAAISQSGHSLSLIDSEALAKGIARIHPAMKAGECVVYRGWMLRLTEYENFALSVQAQQGTLLTSPQQYLATHHLPNWYQKIADLTPETVVLSLEADWIAELTRLGWAKFFIKDFVKSLKTSVGSVIERPEDIHLVVAEMEKYRGQIEGGLCIRRVEDFIASTETRYFVLHGNAFTADAQAKIPAIVPECAPRIDSEFFSVDVVCRSDGELRIVEIGDGQVSDLVGWSVARFADVWQAAE